MPSANIIQLRQLLSDKFPGLRLQLNDQAAPDRLWPTGLPQLDAPLAGGLPKGALIEIVSGGNSSGGATVLRALLTRSAADRQIVTLIDGQDALDVTQMEEAILARLLWVRCTSAEEAVKAADLVLRDANLPLVLVDLKMAPPAQLRRISSTTWYRFQRLMEETGTTCVIFVPAPVVGAAQIRVTLTGGFTLDALEQAAPDCVQAVKLEVTDLRRGAGREAAHSQIA